MWPQYWSFSLSISPSNQYSGLISFRINCLISLLSKGLSRVFSRTLVQKHWFFSTQPSLWSNSHIHTWLLENHPFDSIDFACQSDVSFFNKLSKFVIAFLRRSNRLSISRLQSTSEMFLEPKKRKSVTVSIFSHLFSVKCLDWMSWS